jgi:hypothetical protein
MSVKSILSGIAIFVILEIPLSADSVFPVGNDRFMSEEIVLESAITSEGKVLISSASNLSGRLNISVGESGKAVLEFRKLLKTGSETEANDYAGLIKADMKESSDGLRVFLRAPNPAPWEGTDNSAKINGRLLLPPNCRIDIDADYFDFIVEGPFKSIENRSSLGRLEVRGITERVNLSSVSEDIVLEDISGEISVATNNADIRINSMTTNSVPARIRNENGSVIIDGLKGGIDVKIDYGKLRISGADLVGLSSSIRAVYSSIKLGAVEVSNAEVDIADVDEDVELTLPADISARMILKVTSDGEIHTANLPVRPTTVDSNRLELIAGGGESLIKVDIEGGGDIVVEGTTVSP